MCEILKTTDLSIFSSDNNNRKVTTLSLKKHKPLRDHMLKVGFLPTCPVLGYWRDGKFLATDGQHRIHFARELGLPVYYTVTDKQIDVAELNRTSIRWSLEDFAHKFWANGKDDYRRAVEFAVNNKIPVSSAFAFLYGSRSYGSIRGVVEAGKFEVRDYDYADRIATIYTRLCEVSTDLRHQSSLGAISAICLIPDFDPHRLIGGAKKRAGEIKRCGTMDAYLQQYQELYNHGQHEKVGLELKAKLAMRNKKNSKAG